MKCRHCGYEFGLPEGKDPTWTLVGLADEMKKRAKDTEVYRLEQIAEILSMEYKIGRKLKRQRERLHDCIIRTMALNECAALVDDILFGGDEDELGKDDGPR